MSNVRVYKKGDVLFKEGDRAQFIYLLQTGTVSVAIPRAKKSIELYQAATSQMIGEFALWGQAQHNLLATATSEVKAIEIPVDSFKAQIEAEPQLVKLLIKSLGDRLKQTTQEVKALRIEREATPCPDDQIAKIFGSLWHTVNLKAKKDGTKHHVSWAMTKTYAQRVFSESPKRLEQVVCLLKKLKIAQVEMGKNQDNPDGPEEIQNVQFLDLQSLENFVEFYQHYYFKGGKTDLLKPEDQYITMITAVLKCAEGTTPDRNGIVALDFPQLIDRLKNEFSVTLNSDHLARLEAKGLFAKRISNDKSVLLQFDIAEFKKALINWRILREIEKWNEKGFVDLTEEEPAKKKAAGGSACPNCANTTTVEQKFCAQCGQKLQAA